MKLGTNMEQQKKLRKLEHNTSLAQRQLNNVFDPVAHLPCQGNPRSGHFSIRIHSRHFWIQSF
jgi:hypothetical protein